MELSQPTFSTLDIDLLISTIQNYEFLYNVSHSHYKNNKKKMLAWREVAKVLNSSVDDAMKTWKNVRDRFVKESRSDAETESTWPFFDSMLFYSKYTRRRKKYSSSKVPVKKMELDDSSWPSPSVRVCSSSMDSVITNPEPHIVHVKVDQDASLIEEALSTSSGQNNIEKQHEVQDLLHVAQDICASIKSRDTKSGKSNTNEKFSDYVYARLEEMDENEAKERRRQMLYVLENM